MIEREQYKDKEKYGNLAECISMRETLWLNPQLRHYDEALLTDVSVKDIDEAEARLRKFAPLIVRLFPETAEAEGIIESPLKEISSMQDCLERQIWGHMEGKLLLKMDSHLPIAGSIKARGGIYEVLKHAEELAIKSGMLRYEDDYGMMAELEFREFFGKHMIQVGSTGNLGLSIGITSAAIGFRVTVHMSADARQWKKDLLRKNGVTVVEYQSDYSKAVEEGRRLSDADPMSYFVDDENSLNLFMGYSVAPRRLKHQLESMGVTVDNNHPLFVYLPCGIGGAPGGIAYGLKTVYGDDVHCFFVEPTHAPCMLIGMATGLHDGLCVQDFGIDGKTHADGLAVGRPSKLVGRMMEPILGGIFTLDDYRLYDYMRMLKGSEGIEIEPSACSSFIGAQMLENCDAGKEYISRMGLEDKMSNACHIAWATGGRLVPSEVNAEYLKTYLR